MIIADQPYDRDCSIRWVARPILMSHRSGDADSPSRTVDYRAPRGLDPRKSGSHRTLCWREADSNSRSHQDRKLRVAHGGKNDRGMLAVEGTHLIADAAPEAKRSRYHDRCLPAAPEQGCLTDAIRTDRP